MSSSLSSNEMADEVAATLFSLDGRFDFEDCEWQKIAWRTVVGPEELPMIEGLD